MELSQQVWPAPKDEKNSIQVKEGHVVDEESAQGIDYNIDQYLSL